MEGSSRTEVENESRTVYFSVTLPRTEKRERERRREKVSVQGKARKKTFK